MGSFGCLGRRTLRFKEVIRSYIYFLLIILCFVFIRYIIKILYYKSLNLKALDEVTSGKLEKSFKTIDEAREYFNKNKILYNPKNEKGSAEEFAELANGFWQAEGYIGGFFRSGLNFYPICSATQLLSYESIEFFF